MRFAIDKLADVSYEPPPAGSYARTQTRCLFSNRNSPPTRVPSNSSDFQKIVDFVPPRSGVSAKKHGVRQDDDVVCRGQATASMIGYIIGGCVFAARRIVGQQ
jgi:hypothetical protein